MTAEDDDATDSPETIVVSLGATPTTSNGTASIVSGQETATATITDVDSAVTFKIEVISEDPSTMVPRLQAATFRKRATATTWRRSRSRSVAPWSTGETATVTVTGAGTAEAEDYSPALATAIEDAITLLGPGSGLSFDNVTGELTFTGGPGTATALSFTVTADDDDASDSPDTIVVSLGATPTTSNGTASIVSGQDTATATITDVDSEVTFKIEVISEDPSNDGSSLQAATLQEEGDSDDLATFTITLGGTLVTGETATVTVTGAGTAEAEDYSPALATAIEDAITLLGPGSGLSFDDVTGELTFTGGPGTATALSFTVTADDDDASDSPETIVVSLGATPTTSNGTASIVSGQDTATATITDVDSEVTFKIEVISEDPSNDGSSLQAATLQEEGDSDDLATFTITLGGTLVTGETATVTVTGAGTAEAEDYSPALATAIEDAITLLGPRALAL